MGLINKRNQITSKNNDWRANNDTGKIHSQTQNKKTCTCTQTLKSSCIPYQQAIH